jgi:hypothetical protein
MHTYMDHLRLREEEREGKEAGESEKNRGKDKEREGEGESESTVDRLVCLAADDSSADDSACIGCLDDTAFCHSGYLCSGAWLKILCAMLLEQEGQELYLRGGQHTGSRHSYSLTGLQLEGTTGTRDSTVLDVLGHL